MATHFTTYPTGWKGSTPRPKPKQKSIWQKLLFRCMECGRNFYGVFATVKMAREDGCPGCGSTDVDAC